MPIRAGLEKEIAHARTASRRSANPGRNRAAPAGTPAGAGPARRHWTFEFE